MIIIITLLFYTTAAKPLYPLLGHHVARQHKFDYTTLLTLPVNLALGPYSSFVTDVIQCHTPYYIETLSSAEYRKGIVRGISPSPSPTFLPFIYKASLHATCTKFFCPSLLLKLESERRWSCSSRFTTTAYSDIKGNMHVKPIFDIRSMECCCCHVQSRPLRETE